MKSFFFKVFIVISFCSSNLVGAQEISKIMIEATHVAGNVSVLMGVGGFSGGNVGVSAGEDGLLIIDDKLAPMSEKLEAKLAAMNKGDVKFLINTHWHFDHTGANGVFGSKKAIIVAHENVRKLLESPQELKAFNMKLPASPKEALPTITFKQSTSLHFNGEEIQVIHMPNGHTDGDSVIYFTNSNVLHMGDHFFNHLFPFIDLEHGGSVKGMARNVAQAIDRFPADAKVIPGHGALGSMEDLKAFHEMLVATTKIVEDHMKAGKSLEQIQVEGLPKKWDSWQWEFFDTKGWIGIVHTSLSM